VSSGAWLKIDLLRQRRERYQAQRPATIPVRTLLWRGILLGSVLPLMLLLASLWLILSENRLRQRAIEMQPLADEHDLLEMKLQEERVVLKDALKTNQAVARSMTDVRSSSALLAELRRLVPKSISFDQVQISDDELKLSGLALMPDGLRMVNAFMLSLGQSALFVEDGVTLQGATLKRSDSAEVSVQDRLSYDLSAQFATDAPQAIRPQLAALGAIGLERRLRRLEQEEGLLQ